MKKKTSYMTENCSLQVTGAEVQIEWRIERFLSLYEEEMMYQLHSPDFSFSDAQWFLGMSLDEDTDDDSDELMCLWLCKKFSTSKIHEVKYTLGIQRRDGSVYNSIDLKQKYRECCTSEDSLFVRLSELRLSENVLTADGTLLVFATVRLVDVLHKDISRIADISRELPFRTAHTEEVSSEWKVEGFTSLPIEQNFSLKSPTFPLAGATWCMEMYPAAPYTVDQGCVSLHLRRVRSSSEKQMVAFTLGIRKWDGTPYRLYHSEEEFSTNISSGCWCLIKLSELLDSDDGLLSEGSVKFFCTARVNFSPLSTAAVAEPGTQTSSGPSHKERASLTTLSERYESSQPTSETLHENRSAGYGLCWKILHTLLSWIMRRC